MASRQVWNLKGSGQRNSTRTWIKKGIYWVPFKRRSIKSILLSTLKGADLITSPPFTSFTTPFRYNSAKSQPWNVHVLSAPKFCHSKPWSKAEFCNSAYCIKAKVRYLPFHTVGSWGSTNAFWKKKRGKLLHVITDSWEITQAREDARLGRLLRSG